MYEGYTVPMEYDPLLSKLIAWGNSREEAISRLRRALDEYTITGIRTNVSLFRRILAEPEFLQSDIHTSWLDELLARPQPPRTAPRMGTEDATAIAAALWQSNEAETGAKRENAPEEISEWKRRGRQQQVERNR